MQSSRWNPSLNSPANWREGQLLMPRNREKEQSTKAEFRWERLALINSLSAPAVQPSSALHFTKQTGQAHWENQMCLCLRSPPATAERGNSQHTHALQVAASRVCQVLSLSLSRFLIASTYISAVSIHPPNVCVRTSCVQPVVVELEPLCSKLWLQLAERRRAFPQSSELLLKVPNSPSANAVVLH